MYVKLYLLDGEKLKNNYTIPYVFYGKGNYGLELVVAKSIEMYYGNKTRIALEDILKTRLSSEEINKNFELYMEHKK